MKLFSTVPVILVVPMLVSSLWGSSFHSSSVPNVELAGFTVSKTDHARNTPSLHKSDFSPTKVSDRVTERKIRINQLLISLDRIAGIALQMRPETSDRLEPIIVDLAEQTLTLANGEAIQNVMVEGELDRLEATVTALIDAMSRMIEPEMNL